MLVNTQRGLAQKRENFAVSLRKSKFKAILDDKRDQKQDEDHVLSLVRQLPQSPD